MKKLNIFTILALMLLVVAPMVSAGSVVSFQFFESDTNANLMTIENGESVNVIVSADGILEDKIIVDVDLINSDGQKVSDLLDASAIQGEDGTAEFYSTFSVDQDNYQQPGTYTIKSTVTGERTGAEQINELTITIPASYNPEITISNPNDGQTYTSIQDTIEYSVTDADGDLSTCWIEDGTNTMVDNGCSGSFTGLTSQNGQNTWTVYARDNEGNEASESVTFTIDSNEDLTNPTISITSPVDGNDYSSAQDTIEFTASDNENLDMCWATDGTTTTTPQACVDGTNTISGLSSPQGSNTWTVYANDTSGNEASESVTFTFTSNDVTKPTITLVTPESDGYEFIDYVITFQSSVDEDATVEYSLNDEPRVTMTESTETSLLFESEELELDDGEYNITFYATDLAGNEQNKTIEFSVYYEKDDSKGDSYTGDSYYHAQFTEDAKPNKPKIDLSDAEPAVELTWWQKFINWLCRLFGLAEAY